MKFFEKRWRVALAVAAMIVAGVAGYLGWRVVDLRDSVAASLPARPDLGAVAAQLRERIDDAEQRARGGWRPIAGLAELARLYHANGFLAEASQCEKALIELEPTNARWPYLLANIVGGYGQLNEALPLLQRTASLAPDYLPAQVRWGEALLKLNQPVEAADIYRRVLARDPLNAYASLGIARIDLAANNLDAARDRIREIVAKQPEFTAGWTLLATIDERLDDRAAADAERSRSNGASGGMPDAWIDELMEDCYDTYRLAVAAAVAGTVPGGEAGRAKARQLLERAVEIAPLDAAIHRQLGNLLAKLGDTSGARNHLERATALAPDESDNWNNLITLLVAVGDTAAANRAISEGLAHCPQSPNLHIERGRRLSAAGELDRAAADFEEARRLRPEESNAYVELALIHFQRGQLDEGIAEMKRALAVDPGQPAALTLMARFAVDTGDEAAAKEWIRRCRLQSKVKREDLDAVLAEFQRKFGRAP